MAYQDYKTSQRLRQRRAERRRLNVSMKSNRTCLICGYNNCPDALHWHHLRDKKHNIERLLANGTPLDTYFREIDKCICVCSNCHAEIHAGLHPQYSLQDGKADSQNDAQLGLFEEKGA